MTYYDYIAQQRQAMEEEQTDDSCFLTAQPEGQFVRGHWVWQIANKPALDKLFAGEWKKGAIPELWDGHAAERIIAILAEIH